MKKFATSIFAASIIFFGAYALSTPAEAQVIGTNCTTDNDCFGGEKCINKICGDPAPACTKDADCGTGKTCKNAQCIAQPTKSCTTDANCGTGNTCKNGQCISSSPTKTGTTPSTGTTPAGTTSTVTALTNPLKISSAGDLIKNLINFILGFVGVIAAAMIVYGGIVYMTSAGNDQRIQQGKNILTYAIVGLIISIAAGIIVNLVLAGIGAA